MIPAVFDTLKVLIVDGKRANARVLQGILNSVGIREIVILDNSESALEELRVNVFDAVFCDEESAPLNPAAFARAVRKDPTNRSHRVPIILLSGAPQRRQVEIARDCGINDFLALPLSVNTVRKKLESVLFAPKRFVMTDVFAGPDRRRRGAPPPADAEKKASAEGEARQWTRRASDSESDASR
jgi:PleD family two-component response regulator